MKRVLWISRHEMTPEQFSDLERIMGEKTQLVCWKDTVASVDDLLPAMQGADAIAAVLPMEMLGKLLAAAGAIPVLCAKSARVPTGKQIALTDGRTEPEFAFVHQGWDQILSVEVKIRHL